MSVWKTAALVGLVVLSYFFARSYFEIVALMAGLLWASEYYRTRNEAARLRPAASVAPLAQLLGRRWRPFLRSMKLRWKNVHMNLAAFVVKSGAGEVQVTDVATPAFRKTPFCFVIRAVTSVVREAQLVENSRIPGTRFEYALRRVDVPAPFEAASNMADLFADVMGQTPAEARVERAGVDSIEVQKVFFNGRVLHSHIVVSPLVSRVELARFLDAHTAFHLTLVDIIDKVNFKVPT